MSLRRRLATAFVACFIFVALPLGGGALGATSSGANGDIAFVRSGDILLVSTGPTALVSGATDPSWSPDGTKIAFVQSTIKSCTVSGCSGSTVDSGKTGTQPVWSPDGTKIAYVLTSTGQIHVMAPGGTGDISLGQTGSDPGWSADGSQIVFTQGGAIARMPSASAGTVTFITTSGVSNSSQPAWSPDNSTIAFQSSSSGHNHIYVVSAPSGGSVTQVTPASTEDETAPTWSPDSTEILYANASHGIESVAKGSGGTWQATPSQHTSTLTDATPDWQTIAPAPIAAPAISGGSAPQTGQLLSTTNGSWSGASSFAYQWRRCDSAGNNCLDIGGATSSSYAVVSADVGGRLRVVVTATNPAGSTASAPSNATGIVTLAGVVNQPSNTAPPTITLPLGATVPMVGDSVSATAGTWTGSFPMTFTYQWSKCPADDPLNGPCFSIPGATSSFFTVPASLYGMRFRVTVTATNSAAAVRQSSAATEIVSAIAPRLTGTPPITGQNIVGQTLSVDTGVWQGSTPIAYAYQWRRCDPVGSLASCIAIAGAVTNTYTPQVADIGFSLRVYITASNAAGSALGITNHTFPIVDKQHFAPSAKIQPSITGLPVEGGQLTAGTSSFDGDLPITTNLVWQRCDATGARCHTIASATKTVYSPTLADVGSTLRLAVAATNAYGSIIALSDPTDPVQGLPPHRKGLRIVGTAKLHYLLGTPYDDVLIGGPGNETIDGGGGYDTIRAGSGNAVITVRGPGNSRIYGGRGSSTVYAANGYKDFVYCVGGHDKVVADAFDVVKNCKVVQIAPVGLTPGPR